MIPLYSNLYSPTAKPHSYKNLLEVFRGQHGVCFFAFSFFLFSFSLLFFGVNFNSFFFSCLLYYSMHHYSLVVSIVISLKASVLRKSGGSLKSEHSYLQPQMYSFLCITSSSYCHWILCFFVNENNKSVIQCSESLSEEPYMTLVCSRSSTASSCVCIPFLSISPFFHLFRADVDEWLEKQIREKQGTL